MTQFQFLHIQYAPWSWKIKHKSHQKGLVTSTMVLIFIATKMINQWIQGLTIEEHGDSTNPQASCPCRCSCI